MRVVRDWWIQASWWASGIFATGAVWYFLSTKFYGLAWVAVIFAVLFAAMAILLHRIKDSQTDQRDSAGREAAQRFRSSFAEVMTQMNRVDPHWLMSRHNLQHDIAIFEYRPHVPAERRAAFDTAAVRFQQLRDALSPAMLQVMRSTATGEPLDDSNAQALFAQLQELLSFAEASL